MVHRTPAHIFLSLFVPQFLLLVPRKVMTAGVAVVSFVAQSAFHCFLQSCSLSALFSLSSPLAFTVHTHYIPPYLSPSLSLSTVFTELLPVNCFVVISLSSLAFTVHTLQCTPPYLSPSLSLSTVFTELLPVNCFVVISLSSLLAFTVQCTPPYLSPF